MLHRLLLFHALLMAGTAASTTKAARAVRRQDGPVDPGTAPDCTFFDTAYDKSYNCQYFEESWGISHADFVAWNPSVKDDCSGIKVGNSYCIEVNNGEPRPTTTSASSTVQPTPTEKPKPSPTQDGLIDTCNKFYFAVKSDTCNKIVKAHGNVFTFADFLKWNPAVGDDCSGLWAETYYCVGVPGTPTAPPTTTPPTPTGDPKPSPTQDGLIDTCTKFYFAVAGDTCDKIVKAHGTFTFADFVNWNPAVGEDCSGLWAKTYYCVGVPGTPTARPTTTKPPQTTTTKPGGPSPTQDGIVANCQRYYKAVSGDTCQKIVDKYGAFSLAQFRSWNPAVGADCSGLWLGYYYCIGVPGTPTSPTAKPTATCNPTAPTPTQPVAICGCKKWHKVSSGDYCDAIIKKYGITKANFNKWNPNVGNDCSSLWLGYHVCVGV
ncbi:hypothetical protein DL764_008976 [Monosporascus ibericus]|uniref:LysM domain-containing protein n=1 Tax=Monosporascus ibericus TaxID=155417 RepID=A0A4Q4SW36_9PEZI|nr:hypothetical protein DL764_008976 [Monosporascus ibericus]